jgi:hypothetical protein
MNNEPAGLHAVRKTFGDHWSPPIAAHVNDYDVRVAKAAGHYVWHVHETTDEFFAFSTARSTSPFAILRSESCRCRPDTYSSYLAASITARLSRPAHRSWYSSPSGVPTTGDRHDPLPEHIPTQTGLEI